MGLKTALKGRKFLSTVEGPLANQKVNNFKQNNDKAGEDKTRKN
jgi:hypothetical protein